jgi:hypothetical protein
MNICWIQRLRIVRGVADRGELPASTRRHLDHCTACQSFHERHQRLEAALRRTPALGLLEPSPFLRGRIMAEISRTAPSAEATGSIRPGRWAWGSAAAVFAVAVSLWLVWPPRPDPVAALPVPATPPAALVGVPALVSSPMQWLERVEIQTVSRQLDEPLERELNLVVEDARNAVRVLAKNFVPDSLLKNPDQAGLQ